MMGESPFETVLDRLRKKGWQKKDYGSAKGPNCLVGSLAYIKGINPYTSTKHDLDLMELTEVVKTQYPDRSSGYMGPIPNFNDHPDTTFADVERVLEKAAVKWEEERVMRDD